ncbi:cache domain-containing protein, partial [Devosia sp.]|uniref:cache domain-containing protein n=1 Tax=Devosia sp. TaxID=1871048 RepID=UPI00260CE8A3
MTTAIAALVLCTIVGSIGTVSAVIYYNLHQASLQDSKAQLEANIGVAVTFLERAMIGSTVAWTETGNIESFVIWGLMPFDDTKVIDSITRATKSDATVFEFDKPSGTFLGRTTSLVASSGERVADLVIGKDDPAYAALMEGKQFFGQVTIAGTPYFGGYQPMISDNGETAGAIFAGIPMAAVNATANEVLNLILIVGGGVVVVLAALGLLLSRLITKPIPRLAKAMEQISVGDFATVVPYIDKGNEVGSMARAVEVFRENGLRVSQMTEAEAARIIADQANRQAMMSELQNAFGVVVDAAIAGDFSRQVEVEFPDPELNALASSVNNLVATFNRGVSEIGV